MKLGFKVGEKLVYPNHGVTVVEHIGESPIMEPDLAAQFPDDRDTYADVKDPVFDVLMAGAEAWAVATGWAIGPPDA